MRHRTRGRKLGRNASHRKAMFKNMACSLIRSVVVDEDDPTAPKVPGRIVTTVPKAKELRPYVEKLITMARKAARHQEAADQLAPTAERGSSEWNEWRNSEKWNEWNQAVAPAVALRRRAFSKLRDSVAVDILFDDLAERFADRDGGYTRVVRLATVRLGDAGQQALIEFVGENDRVKSGRAKAPVVADEDDQETTETPAAEAESTGDAPAESETAESESAESAETESEAGDEKTK